MTERPTLTETLLAVVVGAALFGALTIAGTLKTVRRQFRPAHHDGCVCPRHRKVTA